LDSSFKNCTKCGHSKEKNRDNFDWSERDGLSARCKECRKKNGKIHYETNKTVYFSQARERRLDMCEFLKGLKNKPCHDCGNSFPHYVMDFDHLDNKIMNLSNPKVRRWGKNRILTEVAKCHLVCANCHRIRTHIRGQHVTSEASNEMLIMS